MQLRYYAIHIECASYRKGYEQDAYGHNYGSGTYGEYHAIWYVQFQREPSCGNGFRVVVYRNDAVYTCDSGTLDAGKSNSSCGWKTLPESDM